MNITNVLTSKLGKIVLLSAASTLIFAGCSAAPTQNSTETEEQPTTVTNSESMTEENAMMGDVQVVEVEGGSFYYKPNEIRVKKGEPVKIVLNSVDTMHDFVIDELNVKTEIAKSGETAEVEFTPDTVGEFEFYCSVGQHRANGMVGTLIVEE